MEPPSCEAPREPTINRLNLLAYFFQIREENNISPIRRHAFGCLPAFVRLNAFKSSGRDSSDGRLGA